MVHSFFGHRSINILKVFVFYLVFWLLICSAEYCFLTCRCTDFTMLCYYIPQSNSAWSLQRVAYKADNLCIPNNLISCFTIQMKEGVDRYEIFVKRLELSDDPAAKEFLRTVNAQMLNGGRCVAELCRRLHIKLGMLYCYTTEVIYSSHFLLAGVDPGIHRNHYVTTTAANNR
jgi:hypothetical protein